MRTAGVSEVETYDPASVLKSLDPLREVVRICPVVSPQNGSVDVEQNEMFLFHRWLQCDWMSVEDFSGYHSMMSLSIADIFRRAPASLRGHSG